MKAICCLLQLPVVLLFLHIQDMCNSLNLDRNLRISKEKNGVDYNFLVMGDWGGIPFKPWASPFETKTAESMAVTAGRVNAQAVYALGDNFYFNGIKNEYDKRFQHTFEKVFHQESLMSIPWQILAGNHDHYGNVSGQVEYSKHSSRWNFPSLWYTVKKQFPGFSIEVLMIDTVILCGNTPMNEEGGQPTGPSNMHETQTQWDYIEYVLSSSRSEYLLVMGHFPVYSIAEHGPTQCLVDRLKPMLEKYKVTAYFSGHDHNLQHLKYNGTNYFVSGAVDMVDPSTFHQHSVPDGSLLYHWANIFGLGGFATVRVNDLALSVEFHEAEDQGVKALYKADPISPRKFT